MSIFLGAAIFWFGVAFGMLTGSLWENDEQARQCLWALGLAAFFLSLATIFWLIERRQSGDRGADPKSSGSVT
jgi:hypothetical protein